ncbi:MAG: helix-turn-helix domain-containing protein [Cytophagales bacterium]|nr:helix-turn-helix domain-containing protein [Cytophagales bacterium]
MSDLDNYKVYVLLFSKVHVFDFAGAVQVFYEANTIGKKKFDIIYVSTKDDIETEQHIHFSRLELIDDISPKRRDIICVPGVDFRQLAIGMLDQELASTSDFLWDHHRQGGTILSICTGSIVLMNLGLLNGKKASTHWKCFDWVKTQFPSVQLQEESLYSVDANIYTSAGMTTGIDMTLAYLEEIFDPILAAEVARELVINVRRENIGSQKNTFLNFKNKFHPVVYKVQQILQSRINEIVTVHELATEMNMSERNLNRLFKEHAGIGIAEHRNKIKLQEAEKLLLHSEKTVKEITQALGYGEPAYFNRIWKQKHGVSPGVFRKSVKIKSA